MYVTKTSWVRFHLENQIFFFFFLLECLQFVEMIPDINYTQFMLKVNIPMQQTLISLFVISEANYASRATSCLQFC